MENKKFFYSILGFSRCKRTISELVDLEKFVKDGEDATEEFSRVLERLSEDYDLPDYEVQFSQNMTAIVAAELDDEDEIESQEMTLYGLQLGDSDPVEVFWAITHYNPESNNEPEFTQFSVIYEEGDTSSFSQITKGMKSLLEEGYDMLDEDEESSTFTYLSSPAELV